MNNGLFSKVMGAAVDTGVDVHASGAKVSMLSPVRTLLPQWSVNTYVHALLTCVRGIALWKPFHCTWTKQCDAPSQLRVWCLTPSARPEGAVHFIFLGGRMACISWHCKNVFVHASSANVELYLCYTHM